LDRRYIERRRVVVTGLGMLTPLGANVQDTWKGLIAGKSGISHIKAFDVSDCTVTFGGIVPNFDPSEYLSNKDIRKFDEFVHFGIAAATQAINDSGIVATNFNAERIGVAIGSGIGGINHIEKNVQIMLEKGPRKVLPSFIPGAICNIAAGMVSMQHNFQGPNLCIVTACTTGTHNIGEAARIIARGEADAMVAGGTEKASKLGLAGFAAARALSTRNDVPKAASRPWDKDRDGFVLGEGAGIVVLEEYEHAKRRGAHIYCELIGYGTSSDAFHITLPAPDGRGAIAAMRNALHDAAIEPEAIDYINPHATSTIAGDVLESQAIEKLFGDHAFKIPVSGTKSMTGHLLGAAGAVEAIFCILALRDQVVPPTINLNEPDEGCNLDYVPHTARQVRLETVLSNSFGFGGTNGSLIFKKI